MAKRPTAKQLRQAQQAEQTAKRAAKEKREQEEATAVKLSGKVVGRTPVIEVVIRSPADPTKAFKVDAVLDTGCTGVAVSPDLAHAAGLPTIGITRVNTASSGTGGINAKVALAHLELRGLHSRSLVVQNLQITVLSGMLSPMLVGMGILIPHGVLTVNGRDGTWELVFMGMPQLKRPK